LSTLPKKGLIGLSIGVRDEGLRNPMRAEIFSRRKLPAIEVLDESSFVDPSGKGG
jgi:hypothetical protein